MEPGGATAPHRSKLRGIPQANKTNNLQDGIALLRKAIEMEPTSPIAIFNLGVTLCQSGKTEEGETLIYRSVEVDPNYMYGHASIALTEAGREHKRVALDHLEMVTHADTIASDTAVVANMAWTTLALLSHDLISARQRLDMAIRIDPEHPLLERYEKMLKEAEDVDEGFNTGNPLPPLGEEEWNPIQVPDGATRKIQVIVFPHWNQAALKMEADISQYFNKQED